MNENYNQVPNNNDYNQQYDYNNNYNNNVAYNDNNAGYQQEKGTGKNIFLIILGIIIIILIILLLLKFCGGSGKLTGIKIGNVPIIYVGEKEEIQVSALGTGDRSGTKFNFSLKNEDIATLSDDTQTGSEVEAEIKGKEPGDTVLSVTAELGNKHFGPEKADVIVCGRLEVEDITDNTITVERGKTKSLKLGLGENEKCYASLKFDFADEGVARVTGNDGIEGLEAGKTTLTISDGGNGEVTYDVVVTDPNAKIFATGIKLSASSISVCVGKSKTLKATISPSNASDKSVMWSSNKTSVATVRNGRVTGHKVGTAQVTVMTQDGSDKTATAKIKVVKCSTPQPKPPVVKVTGITLSPSAPSVTVGSTVGVIAGIKPTNATNKNVDCKSSNTKIFTVTPSGNKCTITGVAAGTATLTVTAKDGSGVKTTATVTVKKPSGGSDPGPSTGCKISDFGSYCTACSGSGSTAICTDCKSGFKVSADKKSCVEMTAAEKCASQGKVWDRAASVCCYSISHCQNYTSSCSCKTCSTGFKPSGTRCIRDCTADKPIYVSSADVCCASISHCQTYNSSCSCSTCSTGYKGSTCGECDTANGYTRVGNKCVK